MIGQVLHAWVAGSVAGIIMDIGGRIVEVPMERRYMGEFLAGEGVEDLADLKGRRVEVSEDLQSVALLPEIEPSEN